MLLWRLAADHSPEALEEGRERLELRRDWGRERLLLAQLDRSLFSFLWERSVRVDCKVPQSGFGFRGSAVFSGGSFGKSTAAFGGQRSRQQEPQLLEFTEEDLWRVVCYIPCLLGLRRAGEGGEEEEEEPEKVPSDQQLLFQHFVEALLMLLGQSFGLCSFFSPSCRDFFCLCAHCTESPNRRPHRAMGRPQETDCP